MLTEYFKQIKIAFTLLLLMSLLTGIIYPMVVTALGQLFFPYQANGSLLIQQGEMRGSMLLGQSFTNQRYFWGRPSSTAEFPYNSASSGASNLAISNPAFLSLVKSRLAFFQKADMQNQTPIPAELLMGSGSGLDPEVSPKAAFYQVPRIAKARGISENTIHTIINQHIQNRTFGILGEPRVNVLTLNLALDAEQHGKTTP